MYFPPLLVKAISLDVARGLSYLHLIQPDSIVHRDISSANVLLEQLPLNQWRAKLTDYGSVKLVRQLHTANPGSPAYAAPEASNPHLQSPKMDIYSFGALVLEMLNGRLPAPDDRPGMLRRVQHEQLLCLIRCLIHNPEDRPSAIDIISELKPYIFFNCQKYFMYVSFLLPLCYFRARVAYFFRLYNINVDNC